MSDVASKRGRPKHPDVLTPRQAEVLTLVRQGLSNREIAERLDISPDGVKFHVSEIISRTGVTTRREAAEWQRRREQPAATLHTWRTGRGWRSRHGTKAPLSTNVGRGLPRHLCRRRRLAYA